MPTLLVIPNWDRDFENSKSREIERTTFFCVQNHFDGKKIRRLQNHRNALELYGAFHAIAAIASRCWWRGVLLDPHDGPISVMDLAVKSGFNLEKLSRAVTELTKPAIALLEPHEIDFVSGEWQLPESVKRWAVPQNTRRRRKGASDPPQIMKVHGGLPRSPEPANALPSQATFGDPPPAPAPHGGPPRPPEPAKASEEKGTEGNRRFPLPSPEGGQAELSFDQAKQFLNMLFGREKRHWSREEDGLLADHVPISRSDAELISKWFRLPEEHPVFEKTKRKQELTTFLRDFNGELDKIRRFAPVFVQLSNGANGAKKEPPAWRETLRWLHGNEIHLPDRFDLLGRDLRDEYETNLPAFAETEPGKKIGVAT